MKEILNRLIKYKTLSEVESRDILIKISNGELNNSQISSFLTVYMMRNITLQELKGFKDALLELCIKVDLKEFDTIDLCGTGGDGKDTFNISTLASFVTAGSGCKVAKHGNYGVSSGCGSSNVLESLGIKFTNDYEVLKKAIDKSGICFLHAPLFHPAMKAVGPVRRELGLKTFFNMLGPLVNPSRPQNQLVGVFNLEVARTYHYILQETDLNYGVLHALDGYDEISLTSPFKLFSREGEKIVSPEELGLKTLQQSEIFGGNSVPDAAKIFKNILEGNGTEAQNNVVLANAAFALKTLDAEKSFETAFSEAETSLFGLKAKKCLELIVE